MSDAACGVRPITMHCASWLIRADCDSLKQGLVENEAFENMCFLNIKAWQHILLHKIHKIMIFKKASCDPFKAIAYWVRNVRTLKNKNNFM